MSDTAAPRIVSNGRGHMLHTAARNGVDASRTLHLNSIRRALMAGVPAADLVEDAEAFLSAVRQLCEMKR